MTIEQALRLIAGIFVLGSVVLALWHSQLWLIITIFVGINLLQSGLSNWCPMVWFLRRLGLRECRKVL